MQQFSKKITFQKQTVENIMFMTVAVENPIVTKDRLWNL